MTTGYYVYAHTCLDGRIFYIGKGTKQRAWSDYRRNPYWQKVGAKYGAFKVAILADGMDQITAIEEEARLISHFKRFGGLTNILDRGDVSPTCDPAIAKKVSATATKWQTGRKLTAEHRANIGAAQLGVKKPAQSIAMKQRNQWAGSSNPFAGKGERQVGDKNHMAVAVVGEHPTYGTKVWSTMQAMADEVGVSLQAVYQAIKKQYRTRQWAVRRLV